MLFGETREDWFSVIKDCEELVASPGKFQGQPSWVPAFYRYWQGFDEFSKVLDVHPNVVVVGVPDHAREAFPELDGWGIVCLILNADGTVEGRLPSE